MGKVRNSPEEDGRDRKNLDRAILLVLGAFLGLTAGCVFRGDSDNDFIELYLQVWLFIGLVILGVGRFLVRRRR